MFGFSSIGEKLLAKLRRKSYRHAYLAQHVGRGVAYQIRALRDQRAWKQGEFAKHMGKPQSVVHRLEDPDYGKYTLQTLLEVANVFDVALQVRFVPYSSFLLSTKDLTATSMQVVGFDSDIAGSNLKIIPGSEIESARQVQLVDMGTPPESVRLNQPGSDAASAYVQ